MNHRVFTCWTCICIVFSLNAHAEQTSAISHNIRTVNKAFVAGEQLTYSVSWSKVLQAGIAVMEVAQGKTVDNKRTFHFISRTNSVGMVDAVYPVRDSVVSIVEADDFRSLTYNLKESHGSRKRERELIFDWSTSTVRVKINADPAQEYPVIERTQDALSSLYYMRTRSDYIVGKPMIVDIHDSGKNWAVEVHTLGREKVTVPAGEFNTIVVKTYPKYEGVFMHKGEILIWLTDDERKLPVLMKSKISIGSIVATLIEMKGEKKSP